MRQPAQKRITKLEAKVASLKDANLELVQLLATACRYCNNLENYLRDSGVERRVVEEIKARNLPADDAEIGAETS